jgi:hypothetical protein
LINIAFYKVDNLIIFLTGKWLNIHLKCFQFDNIEILSNVIQALINIVDIDVELQQHFKNSPLLALLLDNIDNHIDRQNSIYFVQQCVTFLAMLFEKWCTVETNLLDKAFTIFMNLIFVDCSKIVSDSLLGLYYLSENYMNNINDFGKRILESELVERIISLKYDNNQNLTAAIHILGNICTLEDNAIIGQLIKKEILSFLHSVIYDTKNRTVKRDIIWVVSNICGGSDELIKEVVLSDIFPTLLGLATDSVIEIKKEAAIALAHICKTGRLDINMELLNHNIFRTLIIMLESTNDFTVIEMILNSISELLKSGVVLETINGKNFMWKKLNDVGGVEELEKFQSHQNNVLYEKAMGILNKYNKNYTFDY